MKYVKVAFAALITFAMLFGVGALMLHLGIKIIKAGELSYQHGGRHVLVSPNSHAFSRYYQVAFFGASAGFILFLGVALCMYALAKFIRAVHAEESATAARIYGAATRVAWFSIGLAAVWFVLRIFRGALVE